MAKVSAAHGMKDTKDMPTTEDLVEGLTDAVSRLNRPDINGQLTFMDGLTLAMAYGGLVGVLTGKNMEED